MRGEIAGVSGGRVRLLTDFGVFAKIWILAGGDFGATKRFWAAYNAVG